MRYSIYYRDDLLPPGELEAMRAHFDCIRHRTALPSRATIIGRYSVVPFYREVVDDLAVLSSQLINGRREHEYIADLGAWYEDLRDFTPKMWSSISDAPKDGGPFVLKGQTNSLKHRWNTHMFAERWNDARDVSFRLAHDSLIERQHVYVREYVPLVNLGRTITGMPMSKEFRCFVLDGQVVGTTFYWSDFADDIIEFGHKVPTINEILGDFLRSVIDVVKDKARFIVIDIAETTSGKWVVIELNDGQMSGLRGLDPNVLYSNMARVLGGYV